MKLKGRIWFVAGIIVFALYFLAAARPIPLETVLVPRWLNSLETGMPVVLGGGAAQPVPDEASREIDAEAVVSSYGTLLPFSLGNRFGYVDRNGNFSVNRVKKDNVALSGEFWAEYEAEPERIAIHGNDGEVFTVIENPRGYPFFLDGKTFLINNEQNAVSRLDASGEVSWTYEFAGPLTCVDSAAGLLLTGSLDGVIGVLDSEGRQMFSFEPGGSRYSIILGCAISRDGSRLAIICGIGDQRFLILERFGPNTYDYKVVYHEFLDEGFRRPVYISFIESDRWVVFERSGGLGFYEIGARNAGKVELDGEISAIDNSGGQGMIFAVVTLFGDYRELTGIRLPGKVIIESSFRSEQVFLGRIDSRLIVGGGQTLVSFDLEKR